jgi:membrane-bound ClpP family serine protease
MRELFGARPLLAKTVQAGGVFLWSICTGLLVYKTPPGSLEELQLWLWQPALNGILMALGVLGINAATSPPPKR